ncbi:CDP-glycerol glycerophosphotransferase family protein [Pseudoxanthomonas sp.]|uniref:CDP-glycerol glycerophosphotransferase family protein n=1 Tax=Pseudoxanthomonas sp. TaxID=1871049 RepID=UPI0025D08F29|nr:CDP-glycerol glycerophosphotransferase family protein [Pseudoxanthomonas sp.]
MEPGYVGGRSEDIGWGRRARLMLELAAVPRRVRLPTSPVRDDPASPRRWAMLVSERYSLPILRPVAARALARGDQVAWIVRDALAPALGPDETRVRSFAALRSFAPEAVFATVDRIPPWLPGLQVQLFHGLNLHKRDPSLGQFRMQDLYDLYCTHGPATTQPLQALAHDHGGFVVVETGWPKLDPLFRAPGQGAHEMRRVAAGRPVVMYASTFNAPLSQAPECLPVIAALVARGDRYWLLTLHPMAPPALRDRYRRLAGPHACFVETEDMTDMLHAADVLVCDTSSVIEEFALLGKPVVAVRHRRPQAFMHAVSAPQAIDAAVSAALADPQQRRAHADAYTAGLHPARDGGAADRVLDAAAAVLRGAHVAVRPRRRPLWRRAWRSWRMLRELLPG